MATTVSNDANASDLQTIRVSSVSELRSALANATGGEIIVVAEGNYGALQLTRTSYSSDVVVRSESPAARASFDSIKLNGVSNIVFDTVAVSFTPDESTLSWTNAVEIRDSSNIKFVQSVFSGGPAVTGSMPDVAAGQQHSSGNIIGLPAGRAFGIFESSNITLLDNEITKFHKGITVSNVDTLTLVNNEIHHLRTTPLNGAGVDNVVLEGNHFHSLHPWSLGGAGDHADFVHFWLTEGMSSDNLIFQNNVFERGDGQATLGVFLEDNGFKDNLGFSNVTFRDNVILNGVLQGLRLENIEGLIIERNSFLHDGSNPNDGPTIVLLENSKNATIRDNVVSNSIVIKVPSENVASVVLTNNLQVQGNDPQGENYTGNIFVNPFASQSIAENFQVIPGSIVEQMNVGSVLLRFPKEPASPDGFIVNQAGSGLDLHTHKFDASNLFGPSGKIDTKGATISWDFGDGTGAKGISATHSFGKAATYEVVATVTLADGNIISLNKHVRVETPVALRADFDKGAQDLSDNENAVVVGPTVTFENGQDGQAARLNGGKITFARGPEFFNNSEYTLLFDFKKNLGSEGSGGRIINFSGSFVLTIQADGIDAAVTTDKGGGWIYAKGVGIKDADWHKVALTFSGKQGAAILYVDGVEVGRLSGLDGHIQKGLTTHDLHIGDPFSPNGFTGFVDNVAFIRGALNGEQVSSYYQSPWDFHPENVPPVDVPVENVPTQNDRGELDLGHYPRVLAANFDGSAKDLSDIENAVTVDKAVTFQACQDGQAARLNGGLITYARSPELFNNSEYTLLFDFKKDTGAESAGGRIINFTGSFVLFVQPDGIDAAILTDQGSGWIYAKGVGIKDADWHQVALTFSGEDGAAILYVDGTEVGRLDGLEGQIQKGNIYHSLHIGDPFHGKSFPGLIDNLVFLQSAMSAEEVQANYETPYDFCGTTLAAVDATESSLQSNSLADASGSSAPVVAMADNTNKTAPNDSQAAVKTAAVSTAGATDFVSAAKSTTDATNGILFGGDMPAAQETDSFVFAASDSSVADASDELLTWSPDDGETAPIAADFRLAEELTQVHDAQTPELLLG